MAELRANLQYSQLSLKSLFSKENGTAARLNSCGKTHRGSRRVNKWYMCADGDIRLLFKWLRHFHAEGRTEFGGRQKDKVLAGQWVHRGPWTEILITFRPWPQETCVISSEKHQCEVMESVCEQQPGGSTNKFFFCFFFPFSFGDFWFLKVIQMHSQSSDPNTVWNC